MAKRETRVILALDVDSLEEAGRVIAMTRDHVSHYKVGSILFTAFGPRAVEPVREAGRDVFLDLKFHDIPNTVRGAVRSAASMGVSLLTVHASGGEEMLRGAMEGASEGAERHGVSRPRVIAVTVLTSMGGGDDTAERVITFAGLAADSGADGVVCSPLEVGRIKQTYGERLLTVVPGIRLADQARDDQARVGTPGRAAGDGADFLVVGRSVMKSNDPAGMLARIVEEARNA